MHKYHDFWSVLLGSKPPGFIFGYVTLGYITAIAMIMILASTRDPNSENSPKEWSWRFFWVNNSIRFVVGFFLIPIFIRLEWEYIDDPFIMLLTSIGTGFGFMGLAQLAKQLGLMTTNRLSKIVTKEIEEKRVSKEEKP